MNVIKNLFLPEKIGSYYIFPKHIVGFDINKHVVHAAYVYVQGKKITIKDCLEELIEPGTQESYSARVSAAVTRILNNIPKYDAVHSSMSSSVAIFKTLVYLPHNIDKSLEPVNKPISEIAKEILALQRNKEEAIRLVADQIEKGLKELTPWNRSDIIAKRHQKFLQ